MVAKRAPMTVENTRNWLTGAFVKPEDIIVKGIESCKYASQLHTMESAMMTEQVGGLRS
jgi:hypothetical protein